MESGGLGWFGFFSKVYIHSIWISLEKIQHILVTKVCLILVKEVGINMLLRLPSTCACSN